MNIERVVKIFPALATFFILIGYLKLYLYYDHWDIPIIDYLDISEITSLFLSDVHIVIAFIAIFLFPLTVGLAIIRYVEYRDEQRSRHNHTPAQQDQDSNALIPVPPDDDSHLFKLVLTIGCFIVSAIFICLFFCFNKIWLLYFATFNFMQFALVFTEYIFSEDEKLSIQITFVTSALAFSILVSRYDICKTERVPENFTTSIVTNDTTYQTNTSLLYVGKTSKYLFLFDPKTKTSKSIKNDLIKEITITRKN